MKYIFFTVFFCASIGTVNTFVEKKLSTLIVENGTNQSVSIRVEYRLDQHYKHDSKVHAPYVPNGTSHHQTKIIQPGEKFLIPVAELLPCAPSFCFLDYN